MTSMDGASLFSSLFANQNISTQATAPQSSEGDQDGPEYRGTVAAPTQTTGATALEYRRAERTTLQIRTQEGDLVSLKFRVKDALSARSATVDNGETTVAELSVRARSSTRLKISVQGDLNVDELAAIQSIVEQAGTLANEFYAGGTAEAAALASSLELNPDQLDQVRLRFSLRERLTYTQIGTVTGAVPAQTPATTGATDAPESTTPSVTTAAPTPPSVAEPETPAVVTPDTESVPDDTQATDEADGTPAPLFVDVLSAFDAIAAFLTTLLDALSAVPEPSDTTEPPSNVAARFEMSFKLRVFQSILITVSDAADGENDDAVPPVVEDALDTLAAQQQPLEALA